MGRPQFGFPRLRAGAMGKLGIATTHDTPARPEQISGGRQSSGNLPRYSSDLSNCQLNQCAIFRRVVTIEQLVAPQRGMM